MRNYLYTAAAAFMCISFSGCGFMLPVAKSRTEAPWHKFDEAKASFDQVVPYQTTREDLRTLSFDPFQDSNIEILTYLDLIELFLPNSSLRREDLAEGIKKCLDTQEKCSGYRIVVSNMESRRYGNVFLDLFNFKRKSHKSGWKFEGLFILQDDLVVYKISGGIPHVNEYTYRRNPLGPFQQSETIIQDVTIETSFE